MSISSSFKLDNPNDMEATMSVTMTVGEWRALREQLETLKSPSYTFDQHIKELLTSVDNHFIQHEDSMSEA